MSIRFSPIRSKKSQPKAVISLSEEVKKGLDVGTLLAFFFFLFQMASYVFFAFFVCFFWRGPSASKRVRIWTYRYFFT
jgi:hypothetical protein